MPIQTLIIVEIGENHFGNMELARGLLAAAAEAGAHVVKFQSYRAVDTAPDDPERELFAAVELSDEAHIELANLAKDKGVRFMSSPMTVERAKFLVETLKLDEIKLPAEKCATLSCLII